MSPGRLAWGAVSALAGVAAAAALIATTSGSEAPGAVGRDCEPTRMLDRHTCLACGGRIAPVLAAVGSPRCHDCRENRAPLRPEFVAQARSVGEAAVEPELLLRAAVRFLRAA